MTALVKQFSQVIIRLNALGPSVQSKGDLVPNRRLISINKGISSFNPAPALSKQGPLIIDLDRCVIKKLLCFVPLRMFEMLLK